MLAPEPAVSSCPWHGAELAASALGWPPAPVLAAKASNERTMEEIPEKVEKKIKKKWTADFSDNFVVLPRLGCPFQKMLHHVEEKRGRRGREVFVTHVSTVTPV